MKARWRRFIAGLEKKYTSGGDRRPGVLDWLWEAVVALEGLKGDWMSDSEPGEPAFG